MDNKVLEIFIPGPAGRLEAKYYKSKKNTSPIALVLQPHPQYGGTMNNKVVVKAMVNLIMVKANSLMQQLL
jgi:alpha/beta superfamily hydrolase